MSGRADAANAARNDGRRQESSGFRFGVFVIIWYPGEEVPGRVPIPTSMRPVSRLLSSTLFGAYLFYRK